MGGVLLESCTEHSCLVQSLLLLNGCLVQATAVEYNIAGDLWQMYDRGAGTQRLMMIAFTLIVCGEDIALLLRVIADVAKA